jgi:hypothetical protein
VSKNKFSISNSDDESDSDKIEELDPDKIEKQELVDIGQ